MREFTIVFNLKNWSIDIHCVMHVLLWCSVKVYSDTQKERKTEYTATQHNSTTQDVIRNNKTKLHSGRIQTHASCILGVMLKPRQSEAKNLNLINR